MTTARTALIKLREAPVIANGLRASAEACEPTQAALRARLITAAATVDALAELLRATLFRNRNASP